MDKYLMYLEDGIIIQMRKKIYLNSFFTAYSEVAFFRCVHPTII